jgi:hypothetical protein
VRTFLTLSVGARPQDARPVIASDDPVIVDAVVQAVLARVGASSALRLLPVMDGIGTAAYEGVDEPDDWVEP